MFTFENWAAHRSQKRYQRHILQLFQVKIAADIGYEDIGIKTSVKVPPRPPSVRIGRALPKRCVLQSRIVRGLALPLGGLTVLSSAIALYMTLREVSRVCRNLPQHFTMLVSPRAS